MFLNLVFVYPYHLTYLKKMIRSLSKVCKCSNESALFSSGFSLCFLFFFVFVFLFFFCLLRVGEMQLTISTMLAVMSSMCQMFVFSRPDQEVLYLSINSSKTDQIGTFTKLVISTGRQGYLPHHIAKNFPAIPQFSLE